MRQNKIMFFYSFWVMISQAGVFSPNVTPLESKKLKFNNISDLKFSANLLMGGR